MSRINTVMVMHHLAAAATEGHEYDNWSDQFARENFANCLNRVHKKILDSDLDFNRMTATELDSWGFGTWGQ